jgi:bifunctional ADP-heptose synthase (sugar kinase/adenylyltransferase)
VIVPTDGLAALAGAVAMVDGGFDPIHPGHIAYFRAASELGVPVLCNVSGDDWVARKHPPLLSQAQRGAVIDAIRFVDYVHLSSIATAQVLALLRPRSYVKGADWRDRLPEDEVRVCREHGIDVVFLDTVTDSSTSILERFEHGRAHA